MSIFVGNLPFRAEQEDVVELFAPYGNVVNCFLPLERDTGRKRGFAFVEMADDDSENRAIEALQGTEMMGRPLRINKAEPRGSGGSRRAGHVSYGGGGHGSYGRVNEGDTPSTSGAEPAEERPSGARGWEDRSYGGGERGGDAFPPGRTRRRRSASVGGMDDQ